jgi:uncharacterized protein YjbI with pentapeptide repeats
MFEPQPKQYKNNSVSFGCQLASWTSGNEIASTVPFVLRGFDGSWHIIPSDWYDLDRANGTVIKKAYDDSGNPTDWTSSTYTAYDATYALYNPTTRALSATFTQEAQSFDELSATPSAFDPMSGRVNGGFIAGLIVTNPQVADAAIVAENIVNATITATQIANATITGAKIASATITASNIVAGTITATEIADASITGTKIANATITATNIANTTITATQIANATITGAKIASGTITASNIQAATITANEIANATITATQIVNATITGGKIASATITATNIANATITTAQIAAGTITGSNIASATITGTNIASTTIAAGNIVTATITANEIANLTITAGQIANATITGAKIANATIAGSNIVSATITNTQIAGGTITGSNIASGTITGANIVSATITGSLIANSTITGGNIAATTITASNIASGTITATQIASGTITSTQIAASTITASNIAANTITSQQLYLGVGGGIPYNIGEALLVAHFDGPRPYESNYTGNGQGHRGQAPTVSGGVIYRPGTYGKGLQIAEATTNKVLNPSAETTGNFVARQSATVTRDTATYYYGATSYKVVTTALAFDGIDLTLSALANAIHYVSFWVNGTIPSGANWAATLDSGVNRVTLTLLQSDGNWSRYGAQFPAAQANGSTTLRITQGDAVARTFYIDGIQVEQKTYSTPYCDGSLGTGHSWSGTANASTSSRTAATFTYPATGNIDLNQGTLSFWVYIPANFTTPNYDFGARIDANNYINVRHIFAAARTPVAQSSSGGTAVDTSSGASTAAASAWHHIVVTWTAGALKLYLDGAQSGATANYVVPVGTLSTIEIGNFNSAQPANSTIDDVAILPVVLTATEIKALYDSNAPIVASANIAEFRLTGAGLGQVFGNANGLFGQDSSGGAAFALLTGTVNATTWGGASESLDSGDTMLGSNQVGKANLLWDTSAGQLKFRGGTTTALYIDVDGSLTWSGGVLNANGIAFAQGTANPNKLRWMNGATAMAEIYQDTSATLFVTTDPNGNASESLIKFNAAYIGRRRTRGNFPLVPPEHLDSARRLGASGHFVGGGHWHNRGCDGCQYSG